MTFKFDKNIPVHQYGELTLKLKAMDIGDSFIYEFSKSAGNLYAAMSRVSAKTEKKFTSRKCDGGRRVWRIL